MASYSGTASLYIDGDLAIRNFTPGEVVSDDGGDMTFTPGEPVSDENFTFAGGEGTFVGTINIDGTDYPIFSDVDEGGTLADRDLYVVTPADFDRWKLPANLDAATPSSLVVCFLAGTGIATPSGERPVEELQIGESILTADGEAIPVRWVGRQRVICAFRPPEMLRPVRLRAHALGPDLPNRDLFVTAEHALCFGDLLVNAGAMINGSTIDWVPLSDLGPSYMIYHVETDDHALILANGAPSETYIDYVARRSFDNYAEYLELYGEDQFISEMKLPRISSARLLPPALRAYLTGSAAA